MSAITGAIVGDIAGSRFEFSNILSKKFKMLDKSCWFTDDTVLTLAIATACFNKMSFDTALRTVCKVDNYVYDGKCSFGGRFINYVETGIPNFSFGNGASIRVSYIGQYYKSFSEVLKVARASAMVSHTHPDAISGAKCIAGSVYLAKNGASKNQILEHARCYYPIELDKIVPSKKFDVSCAGSVPVAIKAFYETDSFEDCIKTAISYGGDSDSIAAMAGGIAGAKYNIRDKYENKVLKYLDDYLTNLYLSLPRC